MGMAMGGKGGPAADINMTPMIDVLLVLIIIFMVITPLTPKGLEARVPQPPPPNTPPPPPDQDRTVVVIIEKDKTMKINQEGILFENLGKRLEDIFKSRAERVCFVKADPDLEYQEVAKVIDVAKGVGIDQVGLMTKKVEAGE
jgi:biopolymer transport protein TolR